MSKILRFALAAVLVLAACDAPDPADPIAGPSFSSANSVVGHANGDGVFDAGVPVAFSMTALLRADGSAAGQAFHHAVVPAGVIEFRTRVICLAIDAVNHRAWIGGVITENNSTDPARQQPRHQVGRDIWFRVVDYENGGSGTADRSTFVGFEGDAGFLTSVAYCAGRPWPGPPTDPVDARTNPVIEGNISVLLK